MGKRLKEIIYDKDGGKCVLCGADVLPEEIYTMSSGKEKHLICEDCYLKRKNKEQSKVKKERIPEQLCWTCKKACSADCSWANKLKPVEGWEAVETTRKDSGNTVIHSYHIFTCPLYEQDEKRQHFKY